MRRYTYTPSDLTDEQRAALVAFAQSEGRNWKRALRADWETGRADGPLREIRNWFGPSWLDKFRFGPQ